MTIAMETADTDRELLKSLLSATSTGDRQAFERLYQRTSAKLFGICLRILGERTQAEEALQDVYLAIWRKADLYDGDRASPITWLAMIARNKAIDLLRSGRGERMTQPIDFAAEIADEGLGALELAEARAEGARLHRCFDELTPEQRKVIHVAFFEGSTYEEIAARGDTPLGTVKSWIRRGLLKLKACLQQ